MPLSPKLVALAAVLAATVALVGPAAANATITEETVNGNFLTVKADGQPDTISLTIATPVTGDVIAVNGAPTTLAATATAQIIVEPGGGNDTVNASGLLKTKYGGLQVFGGDGNDSITGGELTDTLNGNLGNDTLVGFKGTDIILGAEGDDVMVWNNGDGSDVVTGGTGDDEVVVNGSTSAAEGDTFKFGPDPNPANPARVDFARTNMVPFTINLEAERLTLNGLAGDEKMAPDAAALTGLAGRTALTLNGGEGNDELTGGDGNDLIAGGDGNDSLTGFKGADNIVGGEGNDVMTWDNGDGSDVNNGDAGDDEVVVNGNPAATDVFSYKPDEAPNPDKRVAFARTGQAGFTINLEAEHLTLNGLGGNDVMAPDATTPTGLKELTALTLNGGEGDDELTGGDGDDALNGDAGNDKLVGFKGGDTVSGGEGDDVMTWNNGDASDINNGEGGNDESIVNGSTTEGDTFRFGPGALAGRVDFARLNLVQFVINLDAEHLTLNGLGGEDRMAPDAIVPTGMGARTALTLNGGDGGDDLTGGDGNDTLNGNAGDDRMVGFKGGDTFAGGEGDDVMVWNNGDGSDHAAGQAGFDRFDVNGAPTAADEFKLAPEGNNTKFDRTNLGQFSVTLDSQPGAPAESNGGTEAITVNGGGGDDAFTVSAGVTGLLVASDGGAGNDKLTGAEEPDSFFGGSGEDTIAPGAGNDVVDGQEGNDKLLARDQVGDLVRGGSGNDSAQTDAVTVDTVDGVEALDATPTPTQKAPSAQPATLGRVKVAASGKALIAKLPISCPATVLGECRTTVTLQTARPVRLGTIHAVVVLGSKSVRLAPGGKTTASVRLISGSAGLASHGKLPIRIQTANSDAAGNTAVQTSAATLQVPKKR